MVQQDIIPPLFKHQDDGIKKAIENRGNYGFFWDVGVGKTRAALEVFRNYFESTEKLKMLVVCPISLIESSWKDDIRKFTHFSYTNLRTSKNLDNDILLVNYETLISNSFKPVLRDILALDTEFFCVIDECFDGNTLIDTPSGKKKIKNIKIGDKIINCMGVDTVTNTSIKELDTYIEIIYNHQKIRCSLNHPFFTMKGWVHAKDIRRGDLLVTTEHSQAIMSRMWQPFFACDEAVPSKQNPISFFIKPTFLFEELFSEVEDEATRIKEETIQQGVQAETKHIKESFVCKQSTIRNSNKQKNEKKQSYGQHGNTQEDGRNIKKNEVEASNTRRERKIVTSTSVKAPKASWEALGIGASCMFRKGRLWFSNMLQDRHSKTSFKIGNRGGRSFSSFEEITRLEKRYKVEVFRVDDIKIYKQGSHGESRNGSKKNIFYDLTIKNHPSFSVNGVLVHNSQRMKSYNSKTTKYLLALAGHCSHRLVMTATPAPNTPLEFWSQMCFVNKNILGDNYFRFRNHYFQLARGKVKMPIAGVNMMFALSHGYKVEVKPELAPSLYKAIATQSEIVKKEDVLDLPEAVDVYRKIEMTSEQSRAYKEMRDELVMEVQYKEYMQEISVNIALAKICKLRQITGGFAYGPQGTSEFKGNPKIQELQEVIEEIGQKSILIFCQYKWEITHIASLYPGRAITLFGETQDKDKAIREFREKREAILVTHPLSAGVGLSFNACDYMVFYSLSYSFLEYYQAKGRIMRAGKKNRATYIHILANQSIDEIIYEAVQKKESNQEIYRRLME